MDRQLIWFITFCVMMLLILAALADILRELSTIADILSNIQGYLAK